jgi:hypothetical protein
MSRRPLVQFFAISTLLTRLNQRVPALFEALHEQMGYYDGFPHDLSASDMPKAKGVPTSVVEAQATGELLELSKIERTAAGHVTDLAYATYELLRLANIYVPSAPSEAPVCASTGREGAIEWCDPTCADYATKAGLCARCYKRESRWRKEHNRGRRGVEDAA